MVCQQSVCVSVCARVALTGCSMPPSFLPLDLAPYHPLWYKTSVRSLAQACLGLRQGHANISLSNSTFFSLDSNTRKHSENQFFGEDYSSKKFKNRGQSRVVISSCVLERKSAQCLAVLCPRSKRLGRR